MIHTKVRLTLSFSESALLKPGLDALNTGLATASHGDFPDFYAEALGMYGRNIHPNRSFDLEMAGKIQSVRHQLAIRMSSRKVRLDLFDIATAQFALRLLKKSSGTPHNPIAVRSLDLKLEKYRKRAKRKSQKAHGKAAVSESSETWRAFVSWCRFNLLYFRIPARTFAWPRKGLWAQQRSSMAEMIRLSLEERCYAPLDDAQSKRTVRLIKEEFHRGRHPMTLRELLGGEQRAGRALLFKLVAKKLQLTPLAGARLPSCVLAAERGEKFLAAAKRRRYAHQVGPETLPPDPDENSASRSANPPVDDEIPLTYVNLIPGSRPTNADLIKAASTWFETEVQRGHWTDLINLAAHEAILNPQVLGTLPAADDLAGVIAETKPRIHRFVLSHPPDLISFLATWLLTWVRAYRPSPTVVRDILVLGYRLAVSRGPGMPLRRMSSQEPA